MRYKNILLIDDDLDDHYIFNNALEEVSSDLTCILLTNAKEALTMLEKKKIAPDIIFLDLNMPLMSGEQFLTEIKNLDQFKSIPVVILSTTSNPESIARTHRLGAIEYIVKPNSLDILIKLLRSILQGN